MALFDQLLDAIDNNNNGAVSELLGRLDMETVNGTDSSEWSPLHYACGTNNSHAVTALLAIPGIQVNMRDNNVWTPITVAAAWSSVEALRLMLGDPRVDIDDRDGIGRGLEELVGSVSVSGRGSEERNNTCVEIIREERRKRENPGMGQHANEEGMESTFRREYLDQIEKVKLEVEESKQRQRGNIELRKAKIKSLTEKRELEKKTSNMKSDQEILKLEQQMRIVQQTLDKEKQKKKTKEEEINEKYEKEKATLEKKFENEDKEDKENLTNLEEMVSELNKNLRDLNVKPENANLEAARDTLECPVCLKTMRPPTRIWMCPASHLVCELCQQRLEGRRCPTCRTAEVTLRAFMAENFARTIFNQ